VRTTPTQAPAGEVGDMEVGAPVSTDKVDVVSTATVTPTKATPDLTSFGNAQKAAPVLSPLASARFGSIDSANVRPGDSSGERGPFLLNYNGDFDTRNGLANEFAGGFANSATYDGFRIRGAAVKDCFFTHNLNLGFPYASANVTVLGPGFAVAGLVNGGLPVAFSGAGLAATNTPTGLAGFGFVETEVKVCGLGLALPGGHYYVSVQPVGGAGSLSYNSTASYTDNVANNPPGAGFVDGAGKGGPGANDDSWLQSTDFTGGVFSNSDNFFGAGVWDFSTGVCSAPGC
jgi:hypothetical protein